MKKLQRFILGLVSSVLLSIGLVRAAEITSCTPSAVHSTSHMLPDLPCEVSRCNVL